MVTASVGRPPRFVYLSDGQRGHDPGSRYGWRLVAANHRPLARGRTASESLTVCRADAERARAAVDELQTLVITQDGMWTWQAMLADELVAVTVRPYLRRIECLRGVARFRAALRVADPAQGVVRHFGPHSLRGYLTDQHGA